MQLLQYLIFVRLSLMVAAPAGRPSARALPLWRQR